MGREYYNTKEENAYVAKRTTEDVVIGRTYFAVYNDNTEEGNYEVYEDWDNLEDDINEQNFIWFGEPDEFKNIFTKEKKPTAKMISLFEPIVEQTRYTIKELTAIFKITAPALRNWLSVHKVEIMKEKNKCYVETTKIDTAIEALPGVTVSDRRYIKEWKNK
jgi:hypothetical protein